MGGVGHEGEGGGGAAAADGVVDGGPGRGGGEPGAVRGACEMGVRGVEWGEKEGLPGAAEEVEFGGGCAHGAGKEGWDEGF